MATSKKIPSITTAQYGAFQQAYDFFNKALFSNELPHVLVTLQRHARTYGYFSADRFSGRTKGAKGAAHELAMNPDGFTGRSDEAIISTLVHEMVHVWQHTHGTPPRRAYHDKQWAAKMKEVGLQPTATGLEGGKETGQRVTHYIIKGGLYQAAFRVLKSKGFALHWQSTEYSKETKKKDASKTKFTCPGCALNAWAKRTALLVCGSCLVEMKHDGDDDEGDD